jgi:hypothetical protein
MSQLRTVGNQDQQAHGRTGGQEAEEEEEEEDDDDNDENNDGEVR